MSEIRVKVKGIGECYSRNDGRSWHIPTSGMEQPIVNLLNALHEARQKIEEVENLRADDDRWWREFVDGCGVGWKT